MIRWDACLAVVALAAAAISQTKDAAAPKRAASPEVVVLDNGLHVLHVPSPEATDVSIALALPIGWGHDAKGRTGCAEVLRWFFEVTQVSVKTKQRFNIDVQAGQTLISHSGPRRDAVDRLAFIESLLAGKLEVTKDRVAVALGRAKLESDNHSWLYPGSVIEQKAWRTVFRGKPEGRQSRGIPEEIARLDVAAVRKRYVDRYGCTGAALVIIGNLEPKMWTACRDRLSKPSRSGGPPARVVHDAAPTLTADAVHARVDGPYVSAAFPALRPGDEDYLAFVVAMIVMRDRAYADLRQHGVEWDALSPPFSYLSWKGESLVRVNRRGKNGRDLTSAREDIELFLQRMRKTGVRRSALGPARIEVANTMAVPPYASSSWSYLLPRARYLATAICLNWPMDAVDRIGKISLEDVNRVLKATLSESNVRWFSLRPAKKLLPRRM